MFDKVAAPSDGLKREPPVDRPRDRAAAGPLYTRPSCACGGIGRRARLRALWAVRPVEVRVLSGAWKSTIGHARGRAGRPDDAPPSWSTCPGPATSRSAARSTRAPGPPPRGARRPGPRACALRQPAGRDPRPVAPQPRGTPAAAPARAAPGPDDDVPAGIRGRAHARRDDPVASAPMTRGGRAGQAEPQAEARRRSGAAIDVEEESAPRGTRRLAGTGPGGDRISRG